MTAVEPNSPALDGTADTLVDPTFADQTSMQGDPSASDGTLTLEDLLDGAEEPTGPPQKGAAAAPIPIPFRTASGRYLSPATGFQLELRVDVDGRRPLRKLSGDYYSVTGATRTYFGSWTVDAADVTVTDTTITARGTARTTWSTTFTVATVTIPRRRVIQPPAPATIRWSTPSGTQGAAYVCTWSSGSFRSVELEQDREAGVTPFVSYTTGTLPSGGPARALSVAAAYAEAGIQVLDTGGSNVVPSSSTFIWNNASLHDTMETHFSRCSQQPQFRVWLLHAMRHELGSGLRGIMFDQEGPQRQGCASFYQVIGNAQPANQREQLYVNVHELGHCFNLFHSFHKSFMTPSLPNRPGALSWMNYPGMYQPAPPAPGGPAAFWGAFPFQFDDQELTHLRHGFRNAVIMGGNPFGTGAALEVAEEFADRVSDTTGLRLLIEPTDARPALGTPVVVRIELISDRPQPVHRREQLHPKYGVVQVVIARPRGDVVVHQPPVHHCADPEIVFGGAGEGQPVSAYVGYDANVGHVFEDPGVYRIRVAYAAPDGSLIASNVTTLRVTAPRDEAGEQVADLMLGDQTGMTLTLLGSRSQHLRAGTDALHEVLDSHADSQAAVYARLALGMSAARPFLDSSTGIVQERDLNQADDLLRPTLDESAAGGTLDELTIYQVSSYLADSHAEEGDTSGARELRHEAAQTARDKGAPPSVLSSLVDDDES